MDKKENMNEPLWERIDALMKSRNLNQKELAAEIGVNPVTITEWKKGKSRSYQKIDTMRKIANALDVSVEELTRKEPPALKNGSGEPAPKDGDGFERRAYELIRSASRLSTERQTLLLAALEAVVRAVQGPSPESETATQRPPDVQAAVATAMPANVHNNP